MKHPPDYIAVWSPMQKLQTHPNSPDEHGAHQRLLRHAQHANALSGVCAVFLNVIET